MLSIVKIATKNLLRYKRRTMLTTALISLGVVAVLLFIAVSGSFKSLMIGQITDSVMGHLQIHRKGYVASIDNLPLNRNLNDKQMAKVEEILRAEPEVESFTIRLKLGAMFSNFTETTNIRLNAVIPAEEFRTMPLLASRISEKMDAEELLSRGGILVPELLAKGMQVKVGDTVVLVATNRDGSVNGKPFVVHGVLSGISGPGGRDGAIHIDDARELLRIDGVEISEIAIRLKNIAALPKVTAKLEQQLGSLTNKEGKPVFEIHTWEKLSPFYNIAKMISLMTLFIKVMLVAIVLVSILNVMIMAVYERIGEIGTIAAIGTTPGKILSLFLTEGLLLGIVGTLTGTVISLAAIAGLNSAAITFDFGMQTGLLLQPTISAREIIPILIIVIGIAVLASLQPAFKASRMDPITALRHV
ncbi:MAG: ABC transporter permease [Desulfurivibrio sp.]|nr:ABC transporter permease [Desulfurivibrio sp.]MBU3937412.1 ABC transporter permease [Pseudomonadota bacterium]MBU4034504.1 ABC transporter permease [Pseudomonadota bacterium]MBU4119367.1 ABC transporter permease [Pseudomonadota bacterium]